jgi:hypothetical protein
MKATTLKLGTVVTSPTTSKTVDDPGQPLLPN